MTFNMQVFYITVVIIKIFKVKLGTYTHMCITADHVYSPCNMQLVPLLHVIVLSLMKSVFNNEELLGSINEMNDMKQTKKMKFTRV